MTAQALPRRPFGRTGIMVPPLCMGCAPLGDMPRVFNYSVPEERAVATLRAALTGPLNYLDTSNGYGGGESERRVGLALREFGGVPEGAVVQTKVDRDPETGSFSAARMRRSVEESLARLGLDRLGIVYLHDPENGSFEEITGPGGAVEELQAMQRAGLIAHLGVAGGPIDLLLRYVETGAYEAVLSHNRYTLLDQSAEPLIALAAARGLAMLNAAPYGGGLLVKGPEAFPKYMSPRRAAGAARPGGATGRARGRVRRAAPGGRPAILHARSAHHHHGRRDHPSGARGADDRPVSHVDPGRVVGAGGRVGQEARIETARIKEGGGGGTAHR